MSERLYTRQKNLFDSYLGVLPATATATAAKRGMELANIRSLGVIPGVRGGAVAEGRSKGFNATGDLIYQSADGVDLNTLWSEYQTTLQAQNAARQKLVSFLSFPVTTLIETVGAISGADFEEATEFGEPKSMRPGVTAFTMGYDFKWYDLAARYTWRFLADAPRSQIDAIHNMALEADNRLVFTKVMSAIFNKDNRLASINGQETNVYALYNGDGTVPPPYKTNTFNGSHTHYLTTGAATLDSADIDQAYNDLKSHGYSYENGTRIVVLMHTTQVEEARTWRRADGDKYDFIPAAGQPGQILPITEQVYGQGPIPSQVDGLQVVGSYGNVLIVEEEYIPVGYIAMFASGGPDNIQNLVGIREHANTALRGMRLVKGPNPDYPLIDSFYTRGFGTGVRQRGGAIIMQVTASGTYTNPTIVT